MQRKEASRTLRLDMRIMNEAGMPTHDYSHPPLDILQNAARVRRIIELDYGHISTPVGGCHRAVTTSHSGRVRA